MHPAIARWCDDTKQGGRNVDVANCAGLTRICDGGSSIRACGRVVDRDLLVADWVRVRVLAVVYQEYGNGDDGITILVGNATGAWWNRGCQHYIELKREGLSQSASVERRPEEDRCNGMGASFWKVTYLGPGCSR